MGFDSHPRISVSANVSKQTYQIDQMTFSRISRQCLEIQIFFLHVQADLNLLKQIVLQYCI